MSVDPLVPAGTQGVPRSERAKGRAILVVDDEPIVRTVAQVTLEQSGMKVFTAADCREGLRLLTENADEIGTVLLDVELPDGNGKQLFREMRRHCPGTRVILMSGHGAGASIDELLTQGLAGFLKKPFHVTDLLAAIEQPASAVSRP
jgi:DNA-binding NtrC family response regulator